MALRQSAKLRRQGHLVKSDEGGELWNDVIFSN
jgi:hypothetical protein